MTSWRWLPEPCDAVNLDLSSAAQYGLSRSSHGLIGGEEFFVNLIHPVEIIEIGEMDANLHYAGQVASGGLKNVADIGEFQARFRGDIAKFELLGCGVDGRLSRDEDKPT
jgi:hypothetical protein